MNRQSEASTYWIRYCGGNLECIGLGYSGCFTCFLLSVNTQKLNVCLAFRDIYPGPLPTDAGCEAKLGI